LTISIRKKREKEMKKNAILKAARKLFFAKGFKSVTVDSIAKKAELSKGSVYLHYKSKDEIYSQILLSDIDKFQQRFSDLFENGSSAADMLLRYSCIYVDFFLKDNELFRILMNFMLHDNHINLPEEIRDHIIKATNKTVDIVEKILKCGADSGEFSPAIKLRLNRNAIWGLLNGIISLYLFTGLESKRENMIRSTINESLRIYIEGLKSV
jgi:AcrR family transcriptional regulator